MNKNKKIIALVVILIAVILFMINFINNDNEFNSQAEDFLRKLYNVSYSDGEDLHGQTTEEDGEWTGVDEYLRKTYGDMLTEDCYDRLVANRILGSVQFAAYQKESDFQTKSINFKGKQERYGEQYYVYLIDLVEYYPDSKEISNEWEVKTYISFAMENGEVKINDLEISNTEYLSRP